MAKDELQELLDELPPDPRGAGSSLGAPKKQAEPVIKQTVEDEIVDQIAAKNSADALDDLYEQESDPEQPLLVIGDEKVTFWSRFKRPKFWFGLFFVLLVAAIFTWLITPSRVWVLNTLGLRTQLALTTLVDVPEGTKTQLLKNTTATINGKTYHTDAQGKLQVTLPYGDVHIVLTKQGYESQKKDETLDFDPFFNKFGGGQSDAAMRTLSFALKGIGVQTSFTAKDWLTGLPVTTGSFAINDVVATPDDNGMVSFTLPATDAKTLPMTATFTSGYANTTADVNLQDTSQVLTFIPAGKDYFVSKRSGQYGVYASNLDGSGVAEIVAPSANETGDIAFSASPDGKYGVLASTRDNAHDSFGALEQKIYIVNLSTKALISVDTALGFQFVDWQGSNLVYTASKHDAGSTTTRLASVDATNAKQVNLATPGAVSVARVVLNGVVYLTDTGELHVVQIKGGGDKSLGTDIKTLTQTTATTFSFKTSDNSWHKYDANADTLATAPTPTSTNRAYVAGGSADGQSNIVVDVVDGSLTLFAQKISDSSQIRLDAGANLAAPIHWIGNVVVYRAGSADYVINPHGGSPKKITDVSPTQPQHNDYFTFN